MFCLHVLFLRFHPIVFDKGVAKVYRFVQYLNLVSYTKTFSFFVCEFYIIAGLIFPAVDDTGIVEF